MSSLARRLLPCALLCGLVGGCVDDDSDDLSPQLSFVTPALPEGEVGQPYAAEIEVAVPGAPVLQWSLLSSNLPEGLELIAAGRIASITGVPRDAGETDLRLFVIDAESGAFDERIFTLTITAGTRLAILPDPLPPAEVGVPYAAMIVAQGGRATGYAWSIVDGALPDGLTLAEAGTPGVRLSGTPSAAGRAVFRVEVADPVGATASRAFTLDVAADAGTLRIETTLATGGVVDQPFELFFDARGGAGDVTWTSTGALPGTTLEPGPRTLTVRGAPSMAGLFELEVQAEDADGAIATAAWRQRIVPGLRIETTALPGATVDEPYPGEVQASAGAGGHAWRIVQGSLPAGLALDPLGDVLRFSGRPTSLGTSSLTIELTDAASQTATRAFTIEVVEPLEVLTTTAAAGVLGEPYSTPLEARGGRLPLTWTILRGSPPGIEIVDTPTRQSRLQGIAGRRGTHPVVVQVTDADGRLTGRTLALEIADSGVPLTIDPVAAVSTTQCRGFSVPVRASGGSNFGYRWTVSGPLGVGIEGAGTPETTLSGLVEGGTHTLRVTVEDTDRTTATLEFSVQAQVLADEPRSPRYAAVSAEVSGDPTLLIIDTCRRNPAPVAQFDLQTTDPFSVAWGQLDAARWLAVAGTFTSTIPKVYVSSISSPILRPISREDRLPSTAPGLRVTTPSSGGATRVFYDARRAVEVRPNVLRNADVVRFVSLIGFPGSQAPQDAHAPDPFTPSRLLDVSGDGRVVVFGDPGLSLNVARPDAPAPLSAGVNLSNSGGRAVALRDDRGLVFETGALHVADLTLNPPRVTPYYPVLEAWLTEDRAVISRHIDSSLGRVLRVSDMPTPTTVGPPTILPGSEACSQAPEALLVGSARVACAVASPPAGAASPLVLAWTVVNGQPSALPIPPGPQGARATALTLEGTTLLFVATPVPQLGAQVYALDLNNPQALTRLTPRPTAPGTTYAFRVGAIGSSTGELFLWEHTPAGPTLTAELQLSLPTADRVRREHGLFVQTASGLAWLDLIGPQPILRPFDLVPVGVVLNELISME